MLTVFSLTKKFHSKPLLNPSFTPFHVELSNFIAQLLLKLFDKSPYSVQKEGGSVIPCVSEQLFKNRTPQS